MKRRVLLLVVLGLVLVQMGVAADRPPEPVEFTTTGFMGPYIPIGDPLPDGSLRYSAEGSGGVLGYFSGDFVLRERGIFNPQTYQGVNFGRLEIATRNGNVIVAFAGRFSAFTGELNGRFWIVRGTGEYWGARGAGTYVGFAPPCPPDCGPFRVTYSGTMRLPGDDRDDDEEEKGEGAPAVGSPIPRRG